MKKLQIFLLLLTMAGGLMSQTKYVESPHSKVIYEDDLTVNDQSLKKGTKEDITSNHVVVQMHLDYEHKSERINLGKDATLIEIKEAKSKRLEKMRNYYYNINKDISSKIEMNGKESMYISKYTPYIEYEYTYENFKAMENQIVDLINDNEIIDTAYIGYTDKLIKDDLLLTLETSDAKVYWQNGIYTGQNVTVGILESGVMDVNHANFAETDCEVFDNFWRTETVTDHAILTSNLIGGEKGILPDARLLSAEVNGTYVNEIEWMMDNGVDIINMSFGYGNTYGQRDSRTEYLDDIILNYDIIMVASSGNNDNGDHKVANPGCGYNIITVGSIDHSKIVSSFSSYSMSDGQSKPNVVVEGEYLTIAEQYYSNSGTSFSCAAVSGMIGMLLEAYPYCAVSPALVNLFLCVTANLHSYQRWTSCGFNDYIGAGVVDFNDALAIVHKETLINMNNVVTGDVLFERTITLPANTNLRFGIGRYRGDPNDSGSSDITDIRIYLYDSYGTSLEYAFGTSDPIQVIERTYDYDKILTMKVIAYGNQALTNESFYFICNQNY